MEIYLVGWHFLVCYAILCLSVGLRRHSIAACEAYTTALKQTKDVSDKTTRSIRYNIYTSSSAFPHMQTAIVKLLNKQFKFNVCSLLKCEYIINSSINICFSDCYMNTCEVYCALPHAYSVCSHMNSKWSRNSQNAVMLRITMVVTRFIDGEWEQQNNIMYFDCCLWFEEFQILSKIGSIRYNSLERFVSFFTFRLLL